MSDAGTAHYPRRMSKSFRLALIPGDGIGTEVVAEGLGARRGVGAARAVVRPHGYDLGARRYNATGETLPASSSRSSSRDFDAILLGAIGDPAMPPASSSAACCSSSASSGSTTTSTCAR